MSRARRRLLSLLILAAVPATLLTTCTTLVEPPRNPPDPVSTFLVDHGRHASLLLPDADGTLVEWVYGEWRWYALDESGWWRVPATAFWPTRGTLGRHERACAPTLEDVERTLDCEEVFELPVPGDAVAGLHRRLQADFDAHRDTLHFQPLYQLDFVHHAQDYHCLDNCNHAVKRWLEELGCRVTGIGIFSDWKVQPPGPE